MAIKKRIMEFTVVFERVREGGYVVSVPSLPGCMTQGENFEEAEMMVKDAIRCYCASLVKNKERIPDEGVEFVGKISVPVPVGK